MILDETVRAVIAELSAGLRSIVRPLGLYAGGSLASGAYIPGISDLDLVAVLHTRPDRQQYQALVALHRRLRRCHASADKLHCLYVAIDEIDPFTVRHPMWEGQRMSPRSFTGIARVELWRGGLVLDGLPIAAVVPPLGPTDLRDAVRGDLTGYWTRTLDRRWAWWRDLYVDLGLLTLPRAQEALATGALITKQEALERLSRFHVPDELVAQIAARRTGDRGGIGLLDRARRARTARRLMASGIRRLTA